MEELIVKFKRLSENAVKPKFAHDDDAGADLTANSMNIDEDGTVAYGTGIAVAIPKHHVGLLFPRSSVHKVKMTMSNCVGVIDHGYTGEVVAKFNNDWPFDKHYNVGDRVAQLIVMPIPKVKFEETDDLGESERGNGGYGSTGR